MSSISHSKFVRLLGRNQPVLLDGGLATQLEAQGCDISSHLWSASLLQSDPEAIVTAHHAYLESGADCITTASYQASRQGFEACGIRSVEADRLMLSSVALARRACEEARSEAAVAASLGPYGAILHDGSEYYGDYGVSSDLLVEFHQARLRLFDAAGADVLALETIPSHPEAVVLRDLLQHCKTPSWVSFSCRDDAHISDGTPISKVAQLFNKHPSVVAIGINCTDPQHVPNLIRRLRTAVPDKQVLAYPNSGELYDVENKRWLGLVSPVDCAVAAKHWLAAGANIIGGCCRMGPRHISAMAAVIAESAQS